jgi:hypothetical protein
LPELRAAIERLVRAVELRRDRVMAADFDLTAAELFQMADILGAGGHEGLSRRLFDAARLIDAVERAAPDCLVMGCGNKRDFVGGLCAPCHAMLTSGEVGPGNTFIHQMFNQLAGANAIIAGYARGMSVLYAAMEGTKKFVERQK